MWSNRTGKNGEIDVSKKIRFRREYDTFMASWIYVGSFNFGGHCRRILACEKRERIADQLRTFHRHFWKFYNEQTHAKT